MLNNIRQYTPNTWVPDADICSVSSLSQEFTQIKEEVISACDGDPPISGITRVQDLFAFGQFLIREQLLLNSNLTDLYRVRRFIKVSKRYFSEIIKYNLDPRRCNLGQNLTFQSTLGSPDPETVVVIVKVLTVHPNADNVQPSTSSDYYVEYVVTF